MSKTWEFLFRIEGNGHKFFRHVPSGRVAVADNSGNTPDRTEDGILWLDLDRPVNVGTDVVTFPVLKESDGGKYYVSDPLVGGIKVAKGLDLDAVLQGKLAEFMSAVEESGMKLLHEGCFLQAVVASDEVSMPDPMKVEIHECGRESIERARKAAKERNGVFRAPHHTVSQAALTGELAISAGGVLYLDEAEQFRSVALNTMFGTIGFMHPDARPHVVLACKNGLPEWIAELIVRGRGIAAAHWEGHVAV